MFSGLTGLQRGQQNRHDIRFAQGRTPGLDAILVANAQHRILGVARKQLIADAELRETRGTADRAQEVLEPVNAFHGNGQIVFIRTRQAEDALNELRKAFGTDLGGKSHVGRVDHCQRPETGKVQIARAGHLYPLLVGSHGIRELPKLDGIPVGAGFGTEYEKTEFVLSPGQAILFITDGVIEAENEENEMFGNDRLVNHFEVTNGPPWAKSLLEKNRFLAGQCCDARRFDPGENLARIFEMTRFLR